MSKAGAMRFLAANVGREVDTVQRRPDGRGEWRPGPRTLAARGRTQFTLDGSTMSIGRVTEVSESGFTSEWVDPDTDEVIHTTEYRLVNQSE